MKHKSLFFTIIVIFQLFSVNQLLGQKNSGIFYSTLYAKEYSMKRIDDFGVTARSILFEDVNGDKLDDGIVFDIDGTVNVALSDGQFLQEPNKWFQLNLRPNLKILSGDINGDKKGDLIYFDKTLGVVYAAESKNNRFNLNNSYQIDNSYGFSDNAFVEDFNGDGKEDLIWSFPNNGREQWYTAQASENGFEPAKVVSDEFGYKGFHFLLGDVTGDGRADLLSFDPATGDIKVAVSDGKKFQNEKQWLEGFHAIEANSSDISQTFLFDIDHDGKEDLIYWDNGGSYNWWVTYSTGDSFKGDHLWINGFLPPSYKNNVRVPDLGFVGSVSTKSPAALVVSKGKWLAIENGAKSDAANPALIDTYEAWGSDYIPKGGTYDSGNPEVLDKQIKMIHDAGFTYVTLDITNGRNAWVDSRAVTFIERVRYWNENLDPGKHKMYINISLGMTRGIKGETEFFEKLNQECKRLYEEFFIPYEDVYYQLNKKPLVIHMITTGWDYIDQLEEWGGDKTFINKMSNRWMDGTQGGADESKPNTYGWIVPEENTVDEEMMPLMPGFWNGITWIDRKHGEIYRNQWLRVLKHQPASIWLNSFNENWEHTSVEHSFHLIDQFVANPLFQAPWTDYYGNRYDSFYWDMTVQYNRLYMNNQLEVGTYVEEEDANERQIFKVSREGFVKQDALPVMAPVLLLPKGFMNSFEGQIISLKNKKISSF